MFLEQEQAQALQEAMEPIERLLPEGEPSERPERAQYDVVGRGLENFVLSMVASEMARVIADQAQRIEELQERVGRLEKALKSKADKDPAGDEEVTTSKKAKK